MDHLTSAHEGEELAAIKEIDAVFYRVVNQLGPVEASKRVWEEAKKAGPNNPAFTHMAARLVSFWVDLCKRVGQFTLPPWAETDPDFGRLVLRHLLEEANGHKLPL